MPHQCTNCGKTFPDGSKEMLSGCPECGGNKFQFRPASSLPDSGDAASDRSSESEPSPARSTDSRGDAETSDAAARTGDDTARTGDDARADTGAPAATPDRSEMDADAANTPNATDTADTSGESADADASTASTPADTDATDADTDATDADTADTSADGDENTAQASARRDVVDPDELASAVEREARDRPSQDVDGQVIEPQSDDRPGLDELREELNEQFESIKIVNPGQYELNLMELYDRDEYIISLKEDGRYVIEVPDTWRDNAPDEA